MSETKEGWFLKRNIATEYQKRVFDNIVRLRARIQGCGEEKKMGGGGVQEKFFGREGVFTKFLKVVGVQNLIFPSDDLFFSIKIQLFAGK